MASELKFNVLPSPTWNWLKMNDTLFQVKDPEGAAAPDVTLASGVTENGIELPKDIDGGMGTNFSRFLDLKKVGAEHFSFKTDTTDPMRLGFSYNDGRTLANRIGVHVAEGKKASVIMNMAAGDKASGQYMMQTAIEIGESAELTLVQVIRGNDNSEFLNDIRTDIADSGRFNLIQIVLGGKNVFLGVKNDLSGYKSAIDMKLGYYMTGDNNLDVNYVASHTGQKTTCDIYANGVLRDRATKTFRGTIDFIKGCKGAKGNEMEDVLLMDKPVKNKTIPVILCAEEDVEGNHGATIGKLAKDVLFYLESRGMSREAVYEMMARARIDAIAAEIPDDETRELVGKYLDGFRR